MYDINLKVVKGGRGIWYIFFGFGIFFLAIMLGAFIHEINVENAIDQQARSIEMYVEEGEDDEGDTEYYPIYIFDVNGMEFECEGSSSYSYPSEDSQIIYFDGQDPETCLVGSPTHGDKWMLLVFMLIPLLFIGIAVHGLLKINKRIQKVKQLNETGKLVKGLPYRMVATGTSVNDVPILKPVIDYVLPNGSIVELHGDGRFDRKSQDADGLVDLVIDEANPDNYFIDFEINRIGGNNSSDYYVNPNAQATQQRDPYQTNYGTFGTFK